MKLTYHDDCWEAASTPWADRALRAGLRWYKVHADPNRARGVASAFPDCDVIYRPADPPGLGSLSSWMEHSEFKDVTAAAAAMVRLGDVGPSPNIWVEGINEPVLSTDLDAIWYGKLEALRSIGMAAKGLRAVVGNFATGNPEPDLWVMWLQTYLAAGGRRDVLHGIHEYGWRELAPASDEANMLGHRRLVRASRGLASGLRWAITECGMDRIRVGEQWVGGSWVDQGMSQAEYWDYLLAYNAELERERDVVCACVYTWGAPANWKGYDMEGKDDFNERMLASISDTTDWTHTVSSQKGLNVRTEPDYNAIKAAPAMVNGQRVRVIGWSDGKEWALINYPAAGWCFAANLKERMQEPAPPALVVTPGPVLRLEKGARFVDVSAYQPPAEMDYPVLELHGYSLVMARVAVGLKEDPTWREHVRLAALASLDSILYSAFSFTVGWKDQADFLLGILRTLPGCPTVAIDLELPNPSKATADLRLYTQVLRAAGVPLAGYTRKTWVDANLSSWEYLADLPLVAAHYKRPVGGMPWAPAGWPATAWQHVAGEKVESEGMYWGLAKTMKGKFIDEDLVLTPWDVRVFG